MSKPIKSYPKDQQEQVIARRIKGKTLGLGYVSALEASSSMVKTAAKVVKRA